MAFISEVNFRGSGVANSNEFVEITLGPDDDPADFVVSVYRNDGTLHTGADIPTGEVTLSTLTGTPDPENPNFTVYVIPVGIRNANSDADEGSGIALTDTSAGGGVVSFYSADAISPITATQGAASGATSDAVLDHLAFEQGQSIQWDYNGTEYFGAISSGNAVLCVTGQTRIRTAKGEVAAKDLAAGDLVWTLDHGLQPIRWVGKRHVDARALLKDPRQRPIRMEPGALGEGTPAHPLIVSPQHRILGCNRVTERMFEDAEVLVPAVKLAPLDGVAPVEGAEAVDYFHLLFERHEIIQAEGALIESLLIGEAAAEVLDSYPGLAEVEGGELARRPQIPAREIPTGKLCKRLVARLVKNDKPFFDATMADGIGAAQTVRAVAG